MCVKRNENTCVEEKPKIIELFQYSVSNEHNGALPLDSTCCSLEGFTNIIITYQRYWHNIHRNIIIASARV